MVPPVRNGDGRAPGRRGFSMLEVQVAFAVLGIGLAGLGPFVVMQLRQVRKLEQRLQGQVVERSLATGAEQVLLNSQTYYLVPWKNLWAQKLTGRAQVVPGSSSNPCDGYSPPATTLSPSLTVTVVGLDVAPATGQDVTLHVAVTP